MRRREGWRELDRWSSVAVIYLPTLLDLSRREKEQENLAKESALAHFQTREG